MESYKKSTLSLWFLIIILLSKDNLVQLAAIEHHDDHEHHSEDHSHSDDSGIQEELAGEQLEKLVKQYQDACATDGDKCNDTDGLVCDEDVRKCVCDKNRNMIYSDEIGKCQSVPGANSVEGHHETSEGNESAENGDDSQSINELATENKCENVDCYETLGQFSICNNETGECICEDTDEDRQPIKYVNGVCRQIKKINDSCHSHEECDAVITGRAWCHLDMVTMNKFCQCEIFHYFDESIQECLPFAQNGLFSHCKTDKQCTGINSGEGLGPHSECSRHTHTCTCTLGPFGEKAFFYENHCYHSLKLGDSCNQTRDCEVSLPLLDVVCSTDTNTCACKHKPDEGNSCLRKEGDDGYTLDAKTLHGHNHDQNQVQTAAGDGAFQSLKSALGLDVPNFVFVMIIVAVVVVVLGVLVVFALKRRHRYSVVRTRENTATGQ